MVLFPKRLSHHTVHEKAYLLDWPPEVKDAFMDCFRQWERKENGNRKEHKHLHELHQVLKALVKKSVVKTPGAIFDEETQLSMEVLRSWNEDQSDILVSRPRMQVRLCAKCGD